MALQWHLLFLAPFTLLMMLVTSVFLSRGVYQCKGVPRSSHTTQSRSSAMKLFSIPSITVTHFLDWTYRTTSSKISSRNQQIITIHADQLWLLPKSQQSFSGMGEGGLLFSYGIFHLEARLEMTGKQRLQKCDPENPSRISTQQGGSSEISFRFVCSVYPQGSLSLGHLQSHQVFNR